MNVQHAMNAIVSYFNEEDTPEMIQNYLGPLTVGAVNVGTQTMILRANEEIIETIESPGPDQSPEITTILNAVFVVTFRKGHPEVVFYQASADTPAKMLRQAGFKPDGFTGVNSLFVSHYGKYYAPSYLETNTLSFQERDEALTGR